MAYVPSYEHDVFVNVAPLTHAARNHVHKYYVKGATNVIMDRFDPDLVLSTIERERATGVMLVPTMLVRLLRHERLSAYDVGSLRLISVGTTSLRLLESAADEDGTIRPFEGDTAIFITPGYRFKAIDGLMTNFHLPRSTLFMLVSALMGLETMRAAYAHAIAERYRFYSYGDASLLLPGG